MDNNFSYLAIIICSLCVAFGYSTIIVPAGMLEGGVVGLGIILNSIFGIPAGASSFVLTTGFFAAGIKFLGKTFGFKTILASFVLSLGMDLFSLLGFCFYFNPIVAALIGGLFCGLGLALIYQCHGATGGADILAQILLKKRGWEISSTLLFIDICVFLLALPIFGFNKLVASLLFVFVEVLIIKFLLHKK